MTLPSKLKTALRILALMAVGVFIVIFIKAGIDSSPIPIGTYSPLYIGTGVSFQIDADSISVDKDEKTATFWVREDRNTRFMTEMNLVGKTVYSHIKISCSQLKVAVLEQRAFDASMDPVGVKHGSGELVNPKSTMSAVALIMICGDSGSSTTVHKEPAVTI